MKRPGQWMVRAWRRPMFLAVLGALAGARLANAQPRPVPVPAPQAPAPAAPAPATAATAPEKVVVISGGLVLPVSGPPILRGTVIVRGSRIEAVGAELPAPEGAEVVDAAGKYVTPGLVAVEAAGVGAEGGEGEIAARLDPYGLNLRFALAAGITTVNLTQGGFSTFFLFGGGEGRPSSPSAVIKLTHGDLGSMLLREPGLNYLSLPARQVELNLFHLREGFRKAAEHLRAVKEAEEKKAKPPDMPAQVRQYVTILENKVPTVVTANTPEEVRDILKIHAEFPFRLVLAGVERGYPLAREIAARDIPVLLKARGPDFNFDLTEPVIDRDGLVPVRLPAAFAAAGAQVCVLPYKQGVSMNGLAGRDLAALPMEAAYAVRGGLEEARALAAITLVPARVLKVDDRVGSLEKGKDADVLIWSRHPLDYRAFVLKAFINGKLYYERDKSRLFKDVPLQ